MILFTRHQLAFRIGQHIAGIRGPEIREYWSERNRTAGWRVLPLGGGWRAFYRKDHHA